MRARPTLLMLLCVPCVPCVPCTLGCQRPVVVAHEGSLVAPDDAGPSAGTFEVPGAATVEPAPSESPPTWEWALSVVPELAEHAKRAEVDRGEGVLARFVSWFDERGASRVYFLSEGTCHAVEGTMSGDGFEGRWREEVTTEGDERRVSHMSLDITRGGITESGPSGIVYRRDEKGRWQEAGGFGIGGFAVLVERSMSAVDDGSVTFAGYDYHLEPVCGGTLSVRQSCIGGGERRCERCGGVSLRPVAEPMGSGRGESRIQHSEPAPIDCTGPCPVDEWTPLLPRLATALAGRRFPGVREGEGPVVFRTPEGCARGLRRQAR